MYIEQHASDHFAAVWFLGVDYQAARSAADDDINARRGLAQQRLDYQMNRSCFNGREMRPPNLHAISTKRQQPRGNPRRTGPCVIRAAADVDP